MAALKEVLAYLLGQHSRKDGISLDRISRMVYLADWKAVLETERQLTRIEWYFGSFGPYAPEVVEEAQSTPEMFSIHEDEAFWADRKRILKMVATSYFPRLTRKDKEVLDHVVRETKILGSDEFIKLVYSTFPIVSSQKYSPIDLVEKAVEYKQSRVYRSRSKAQ